MLRKNIFLCLTFLSLASFSSHDAHHCLPSFYDTNGWLGGDVAYSIPISGETSLWLFGDTFIGKPTQNSRFEAAMIANSVAFSQCHDMKFLWSGRDSNRPGAVFESGISGRRYWPMDGFEHRGSLYVALIETQKIDNSALGFEFMRVMLAKISNFMQDINHWKLEISELMSDKSLIAGISIIKQETYAILVTLLDRHKNTNEDRPVILLRIPLDKLNDAHSNLEYLNKNLQWKPGIDKANAHRLFNNGMTEMSVRYHKNLNQWIAVSHHTDFPSKQIVTSTASALEGPWSPWKTAYTTPEMVPGSHMYDPDTFCYAGKEQFQLSDNKYLAITYVCNSFVFNKQLSNLNIYRPKVVQIPYDHIL